LGLFLKNKNFRKIYFFLLQPVKPACG